MKELFGAFKALEQLGASWKTRRVSKKFLFDTIECTALFQTAEGVIRGLVEVQRWKTYCRAKMEVACFLDGKLDDDGKFKHARHPKDKTVKIFEYDSEILYHCSKVFGIKLGYRPDRKIPAEHQFLVNFAERLAAEFDTAQKADSEKTVVATEERQRENEEKARHALFG